MATIKVFNNDENKINQVFLLTKGLNRSILPVDRSGQYIIGGLYSCPVDLIYFIL